MRCKFCPSCGKATVGDGRTDHCGNCGCDISSYAVMDSGEMFGKEALTGALDDNILIRSSVTRLGASGGNEGKGAGGISDSVIQRSVVTTIGAVNINRDAACPLCDNALSDENVIQRCPICSVRLCQLCAQTVEQKKQERYRGYRLDIPEGICPQCYRVETGKQKGDIDRRVNSAMSSKKREVLMRSYTDHEKEFIREGNALMDNGEYGKALAKFDSALALNRDNLLAGEGRWTSLMALSYYRETAEFVGGILKKRPDLGKVYLVLAEALHWAGNTEGAKAVLIERTMADGMDPLPWLKLGELYLAENDLGKALSLFRRSAEVDRKNRFVEPYIYLASIMVGRGEYSAGREYLGRGREIDRDNTDLGVLGREMLKLEALCRRSLSDDRKALEEAKDREGRLKLLLKVGNGYAALGDRKKAVDHFRKYLEIEPGDGNVRKRMEGLGNMGE